MTTVSTSTARAAFFLLLIVTAVCCGGRSGGDGGPTAPIVTVVDELQSNPQTWSALPNELTLAGSGPGFHPTKTIRVGGGLRTYYVRPTDSVVVFAESSDGMNFTSFTSTNIRRVDVQGDNRAGLDHPTVMQRADGRFLMVYDYRTDLTTQFAKRLVARISDDGVTFGQGVLLPASSIDNSPGSGQPFQSVTGLVRASDGSIRAYYTAAGGLIASARSGDGGITWTQDGGYRLGVLGGAGFIDTAAITDVDGSILLYVGYVLDFGCPNGAGTAQGCVPIRMARSTDGLNFKVYAGNVLTPPSGPTRYADPDVFITPSGRWRMLFGDVSRSGNRLRIADRQ